MKADDRPDNPRPTCLLSFDVEEVCQIEAARGTVDPLDWTRWPSRLEANVDWLLGQLAEHRATATFFVLGWVARRRPWVVRRIAEAGHELACHGYAHDRLHRLDPRRLAIDLAAARLAIEDQAGQRVQGYRAPSFSLTADTAWAVDVLIDQGFTYDSSVQPIRHPAYGQPDAPRWHYRLAGPAGDRTIAELPPITRQLGRLRMPVAGGGYFRMLPLTAMRGGIMQAHRHGRPAVLYFHPWEFDPGQPRLPLPKAQRIRTYSGLDRTRGRLQRLLGWVKGRSIGRWLAGADTGAWPTYRLPPAGRTPGADQPIAALDTLLDSGDPLLHRVSNVGSVRAAA